MPIIGWKNYWYGKYRIIDYLNTNVDCGEEIIINIRFDVFKNSNNFLKADIMNLIKVNIGKKMRKNKSQRRRRKTYKCMKIHI